MSFEPGKPQGNSAREQWFQEVQDTAYRGRQMLVTPDTLTHQTTQGVYHRPKPTFEAELSDSPASQQFSFEARFIFRDSLNRSHIEGVTSYFDGFTQQTLPFPSIESQLFGCSLGSDSQREIAIQDAGSVNSDGGGIAPWSPILVLPTSIPEGWILDMTIGVLLQSQTSFREYFRGDIPPFIVSGDGPSPSRLAPWFTVSVSDNNSIHRGNEVDISRPGDGFVNTNRIWRLPDNSQFRAVRYWPKTGNAATETYVCVACDRNNSVVPSFVNQITPLTDLFPLGITVFIMGRAFDATGKAPLFGTHNDSVPDWALI